MKIVESNVTLGLAATLLARLALMAALFAWWRYRESRQK
jgi:hypothetical protein